MENKNLVKICDLCQNENATIICYECPNYYCDSCFKLIHEIKINNEHKKYEIDPFIFIKVKCPEHSKIINNLYNLDEKGKQ